MTRIRVALASHGPDHVRRVLLDYLADRVSAPVAVARLLFHDEPPARLGEIVRAHRLASEISGVKNAARIDALEALLAEHVAGAAQVQALIREHERTLGTRRRLEAIEGWRRFFDESVTRSEAGSVAAYTLGSEELLAEGTREIVAFLDAGGLLGPRALVLEIGCGVGRLAGALGPRVSRYHGTDISAAMLARARRRVSAPNVSFSQTSGRDLASLAGGAFDLVLAVDSFPYVHDAGPALVDDHFGEVARVLAPRGRFLVFNFSYLGDPDAEGTEVATLAGLHGFELEVGGVRPFRLWDGVLYQLRKRAARRHMRPEARKTLESVRT